MGNATKGHTKTAYGVSSCVRRKGHKARLESKKPTQTEKAVERFVEVQAVGDYVVGCIW